MKSTTNSSNPSSASIIIIPARYDSSRLPGKPLIPIHGMSLIERVWRIACSSRLANQIYVATDNENIASHVSEFGGKILMTPVSCATGTDRVAVAAQLLATTDETIIISLQGDAVLTPPWIIDDVISTLQNFPQDPMATPVVKLVGDPLNAFLEHKKISPSSGTTVVFNQHYQALYFSKQPIPFLHSNMAEPFLYRHIGLYGYRYKTLKQLQNLPQSPLEKIEKLEQLRALENGIPIRVVPVDYQGRTHGSIDTQQDIGFVEKILSIEGELYPQQMIFRLGGERSSNRSVYKIPDCCEKRETNNTENSSAKGIA